LHRLLPRRSIARAPGEQRQALIQPGQHGGGREHVDARRRQLDRQRQAVEAGADGRHRRGVLLGQRKRWAGGLGALDEKPHRVVGDELIERDRPVCIGERERRNLEPLLPRDAQDGAAGDDHLQAGALPQQLDDHAGAVDQMLEVIEHQQQPLPADGGDDPLDVLLAPRIPDLERLHDRRGHELRVGDRRQQHHRDVVDDRGSGLLRKLEREAGFADAAGTGQRQQAHMRTAQQLERLAQLLLAADDGGQRRRRWRDGAGSGPARDAQNRLFSVPIDGRRLDHDDCLTLARDTSIMRRTSPIVNAGTRVP
jgi:hypothetical protein